MATRQIKIPEIGSVTLYKRRGNRSMRLTIGANGDVRVSLPYWLPYKAGEQFAQSKASWILANKSVNHVSLKNGHAIGKTHRLYFVQTPTIGKISTRVATDQVRVSYPSIYTIQDPTVQIAATRASIQALRKEARTLLPERLQALSSMT